MRPRQRQTLIDPKGKTKELPRCGFKQIDMVVAVHLCDILPFNPLDTPPLSMLCMAPASVRLFSRSCCCIARAMHQSLGHTATLYGSSVGPVFLPQPCLHSPRRFLHSPRNARDLVTGKVAVVYI